MKQFFLRTTDLPSFNSNPNNFKFHFNHFRDLLVFGRFLLIACTLMLGMTSSLTGQSISITSVSPTTFCANVASPVTVNFSFTGFSGIKTFTAQLSSSSGSFASPTLIGTVGVNTTTNSSGIISGSINKPAGAGYLVRVIQGATQSGTVGVTIVSPPTTSNAGSPQSICLMQTATLAANTPAIGTGAWSVVSGPSTSNTQFSSVSNPAAVFTPAGGAGIYVLRWTITNGPCTASTSNVTITVNGVPTPTILIGENSGTTNNDGVICAGASVNLDAGVFNSYSWAPGGATTEKITVNPSTTTVYTVTVTAANGCSGTGTVSISVNSNPTPAIVVTESSGTTNNDGTICAGAGAILDAGSYNAYLWSGGQTSQTINVNPAMTSAYTVTVTNAFGCTGTGSITITVNPLPTAAISITETSGTTPNDGLLCSGASATLTASGGTGYAWSSGGNTASITVSTSGTYTVTVTDGNGCSSTASVSITVNPLPAAVISVAEMSGTTANDGILCMGASAVLTASGGSTYHWNTGENTASITVSTAGSYAVTVTDANGCSSATSVAIVVNPLPTASIDISETSGTTPNDGILCAGESASLTASGGTGYAWSTGANAATITVSSAGTYTVTVTNGNGCTATTSVSITVNALPSAAISIDESSGTTNNDGILCTGAEAVLTASGGSTYHWDTGDNTASITVSTAGSYAVTVTDANGCASGSSVAIVVHSLPTAAITIAENSGTAMNDGILCSGASAALTASGGTDYIWSTGDDTPSITVSTTGSYGVTVTDGNGCSSATSVAITVLPLPDVSISITETSGIADDDGILCEGASAVLAASAASSYAWSTGDNTASITVSTGGDFTVTVTNENGCTGVATVTITISTPPALFFTLPPYIYVDAPAIDLTTFVTPGGGSFSGTGVSGNFFDPSIAGVGGPYPILYTYTDGATNCTYSITKSIEVLSVPPVALLLDAPDTIQCGTNFNVYVRVDSGFLQITSLQFSLQWDTSKFDYVSSAANVLNSDTAFVNPTETNIGHLGYTWIGSNLNNPDGLTIITPPDSTLMVFTLKAKGCGMLSPIKLGSEPLPSEAFNVINFFEPLEVTGNVELIRLIDTLPPTFSRPKDITIYTDAACNYDASVAVTGDVTDEMDGCSTGLQATFTDDTIPGECQGSHVITRTWHLVDNCGNAAADQVQTILILDNLAPVATAPDMIQNIDCPEHVPAGVTTIAGFLALSGASATDNCTDQASLIVNYEDGALQGTNCAGIINRTYSITDACGNTTNVVQVITIHDATAPVATCPGLVSVSCTTEIPAPNPDSVTTTDNCTGTVIVTHLSDIRSDSTCANRYTLTRTFHAQDACGNSTNCTQTIMVFDQTPPVATCPSNKTVSCTSEVPTANIADVTVEDNCGGTVTVTNLGDVKSDSTCSNRYTITRTYHAVDGCGNSTNCVQTITVFDETPPVAVCPNPVTVSCASMVPTANIADVSVSDNCSGTVTVTNLGDVKSDSTCSNRYTITRTYHAQDGCGNSTNCVQTITVFDETSPVATCPETASVSCTTEVPSPAIADVTVEDNCGGTVTVTYSGDTRSDSTCANRYTLTRTYHAQDACGNSTDCTQTIIVDDEIAPDVFCPADVTVSCTTEIPAISIDSVLVSDNCDGNVTVTHLSDVTSDSTCSNRYTVTRTYGARDECGNAGSCSQTITVFDKTAPSVICPSTVEVSCASGVPHADPATVQYSDNCDGAVEVSFVGDEKSDSTCTNRYTITRTYHAQDACGNSTNCVQTILINDQTPPVATCPSNKTVSCATEVPTTNIADVTVEDNCGGTVTVTNLGDVKSDSTCSNRYTITRTYHAVDGCGNSTNCVQTITVFDETPPVAVCPNPVTVSCASMIPTANIADVSVSDNCSGTVTVTNLGDVKSDSTCSNRYTITRTYHAQDGCGNSTNCVQTITVFDETSPVATCPETASVSCTTEVPSPAIADVTVEDNCGGTVTVTYSGDTRSDSTCANRYTLTRTYHAADACGNSTDCSQTIIVDDEIAPDVLCPADVTVSCTTEIPAISIDSVLVSDNCDGNVTVTHLSDVTSDSTCSNRYTVTRTYGARDECGNAGSCSQTITVFDKTAPSVICPSTVEVSCASGVPHADPATVQYSDNCDGAVEVSFVGDEKSDSTCANRYTITRTYHAQDGCGNSTNCVQTILINDQTPPVATCPSNKTVSCSSEVPTANIAEVTVEDNCGGTVTVTNLGDVKSDSTCSNRYTITRTYHAVDGCGNSTNCVQTITVFDETPPVAVCPNPVTVSCASMVPTANIGDVSVSDNCGGTATVTNLGDVKSDSTCSNRYTITRTYHAQDGCGNSTNCVQTITVFDETSPVAICPETASVSCTTEVPSPAIADVTVEDNCGGTVTVTYSGDTRSDSTCANRYTLTRTYHAADACGNSTDCTQTIIVDDEIAPDVFCPADVMVSCTTEIPAISIDSVLVSDNCDGNVTVTHLSDVTSDSTCSNRYTVTRTYGARDECGNAGSCSQTITVFDKTAPSVICPSTVEVSCASGVPHADPATVQYSDNCDGAVEVSFVGDEKSDSTCTNRYTITRTYHAQDACGNSTNCIQTILINDQTPPVATCPSNKTVSCSSEVPTTNIADVTVEDNCGGTVTVTNLGDVKSDSTCSNRYTITRTYHAVDGCGNSTNCVQTITVFDETPPVAVCPNPVTVSCASMVPTANIGDVSVSDNCGGTMTVTNLGDVKSDSTCSNRYTITRTYHAQDGCGNSTNCVQTITVFDETSPVATCPETASVSCTTEVPSPAIADVTVEDNCGGTVTVTYSGDTRSDSTCANRYTLTRTYHAQDACGNSTDCSQTIIVDDEIAPDVFCPADVTVSCTTEIPAISIDSVLVSDNCDGNVTVTHLSDVTSDSTCSNRYTVTRTYGARDECGNAGSCSQTITVFDKTAPSVICPSTVEVSCASGVPHADPATVQYSDNCDGAVEVSFVGDEKSDSTCTNRYTITRTYHAQDACGNSTNCIQTILINDQTPPVATCPSNKTISCTTEVPTANIADVTVEDNCGGTVTVTNLGDVKSDSTCSNRYTITRTYHAVDGCGNSTNCVQTITVFDETPPVAICPDTMLVSCLTDVPAVNINDVTVTDNCTGVLTVSFVADTISDQTCANRFTITRIYHAFDICGNSTNCVQTIKVADFSTPSAACPDTIKVFCTTEVPIINTNDVFVSDNCNGAVTVSFVRDTISDSTCANRYTITRTYHAQDACGNSTDCSQTIIVDDEIAPDVFCPANVTVSCTTEIPAISIDSVLVSDNCDGNVTVTHLSDVTSDSTCSNRYTVTRTYGARDECGNAGSCSQTITVFDKTAPSVICPSTVEVSCASGVPHADPATVQYSDNCDGAVEVSFVGDEKSDSTCSNRYRITRTYHAQDACGNSTNCIQTILINDQTPPVATCPSNKTVSCSSEVPTANIAEVTVEDNCGGTVTVTNLGDVKSDSTCSNRYTITRTYHAVDGCGNSTNCVQTITVFDETPPVAVCPNPVTVSCASMVPTANVADVSVSDNCSGTVTVTNLGDVKSDSTCSNRYTITRTYNAQDGCGNSTNCIQTIVVDDETAPSAICKNISITLDNTGHASITAGDVDNGSTDNCGTVTLAGVTPSAFSCHDVGTNTATLTVSDACGNQGTCTATVTVKDLTPPVIASCPGDQITDNTTDSCSARVTWMHSINTDACGIASQVFTAPGVIIHDLGPTDVSGQFPVGVTVVTYTVIDVNGNSTTCTFTVTVNDTQAPVIANCPSNITVPNTTDQCGAIVNWTAPTASDNCPGVTLTSNHNPGEFFPVGTTGVLYTATDHAGTSTTCQFVVKVIDTQLPVIACPTNITQANDPGLCGAVVQYTTPVGSDNCPGVNTVQTAGLASGASFPIGTTTNLFTVTDAAGNSTTCAFTITIQDTQNPVAICPTNISQSNDPGICGAVVHYTAVIGTDNCPGPTVVQTGGFASGATFPVGTTTNTFKVTDASGNTALCSFTVQITDTESPTITCPANIIVSNDAGTCGAVVTYTAPVGTDNCPGSTTVQVLGLVSGATFPVGTTSNIFKVTDQAGLMAVCSFSVIVNDVETPSISCPANISQSNDPGICGAVISYSTPVGTDNCSVVTTQTSGLASGANFPVGVTVNTFKATDASGHFATCSFTVTVQDTEAPTFMCPADRNVALDAGCSLVVPNLLAGLTGHDNCGVVVFSQLPPAGTVLLSGHNLLHKVQITATDGSGNHVSCQVFLTAKDSTPPVIMCPASITVPPSNGKCSADVNGIDAVYSDNCGIPSLSFVLIGVTTGSGSGQASGLTFNVGKTQVTYTATDAAGNSSTCNFIVTVSPCIQISGSIKWENNLHGVKDATVRLNTLPGLVLVDTKLTDSSGNYTLIAGASGDYRIAPTKNINLLNGVTTADAMRIQQHLTGLFPLPAPFKRIAADVNKSNSITSVDVSLINQALLGNPAALAIFNTSWRFVPTSYIFPNPNIPWGFPESITLTSVTSDVTGQDFYGIKLGDVNGTANPLLNPATPLVWLVDDQVLEAGKEITVSFAADHFNDIAAYQFALGFDPAQLQMSGVVPTDALDLTTENFGTYNINDGELRAVWNTAQGKTLQEGARVFTLHFKALQSGLKLSEVLHLDEDVLPGYAFNTLLEASGIQLVYKDVQVTTTQEPGEGKAKVQLLQNRPNPFVDRTTIGFILPEACDAQLRILDVNGRVLAERSKFYAAGYQEETFLLGSISESGVLYYELTTPFGKAARKMVVAGR